MDWPSQLDSLIAIGVWGELRFAKRAREADDGRVAEANKLAAEANERAAEAQLHLEQLRKEAGPRVIDRVTFLDALKGKSAPEVVKITYSKAAGDGWAVAFQINALLREAGWTVWPPYEALDPNDPVFDGYGGFGGPQAGIRVLRPWGTDHSSEAEPHHALMQAFVNSLGSLTGAQDEALPAGTIRIVIFPR